MGFYWGVCGVKTSQIFTTLYRSRKVLGQGMPSVWCEPNRSKVAQFLNIPQIPRLPQTKTSAGKHIFLSPQIPQFPQQKKIVGENLLSMLSIIFIVKNVVVLFW